MPSTFGKMPPRTVGDVARAQRERVRRGDALADRMLAWMSFAVLVWAALVVFQPEVAAAGMVTVARLAGV